MSNFVEKHPFFAMAMVCIVCNTISDVVKYITDYHSHETYKSGTDGSWVSECKDRASYPWGSDTTSESKKCIKYGEELLSGIKAGLESEGTEACECDVMSEAAAERELERIFDTAPDFDEDQIFAESDGDPNHEGTYDIPELKVTKS